MVSSFREQQEARIMELKNAGPVEPMGSVAVQVEYLGKAVASLNEAIRNLQDKIEPVLRDVEEKPTAAAEPSKPTPSCSLAKELSLQVGYVESMASYVSTLARRVDL